MYVKLLSGLIACLSDRGFFNAKKVIKVTNYTGKAHKYIKKLIAAMGATFTPSISGDNTALITA
jgi:hypothetical protein